MTTFTADVTISGDTAAGTMTILIEQQGQPAPVPEPPEDGWQPPDWLRTDTRVEAIPDVPRPGYLEPWQDPVFKTTLTRVTDDPGQPIANIPGAIWGEVAGHHYSSDQAWNCDQSLLYLDKNNGSGAYALCLDGDSYEPLFPVSGLPTDVRWHPSDPALMHFVDGAVLGTFNPRTGARQTIMDFGPKYSAMTFGGYEGSFTEDGAAVVIMCQYAGQTTGFAYNVATGAKGKNIWASEIRTGAVCDNIRISSNGNYILWGFDPDLLVVSDLDGGIVTTLEEDQISHFDVITDGNGDECVVGRVNGDVGYSASGRIGKYRLRDGQFTELSGGGWSYHTSCRALARRRWAVASAGDEGGAYPPYNGEIILCELDGSAVYRCGHSHVGREVDYSAETQPSHAPDGSRIVFRSAWNGSGPVADFVIDLRG